jgi:hypothetical protein
LPSKAADGDSDPNGDLAGMSVGERKAAGRSAALRLFDCLWLGSEEPEDDDDDGDEGEDGGEEDGAE